MSTLVQDVKYALRSLGNSPGFTTIAALTLAIGIGANATIYSFVDGILLKPLPYENADRIVRVLEKPPGGFRNGISTLNFLDWQKQNQVFEYMAAQTGGQAALSGAGDPVLLRGARVSAQYFNIFGIKAHMGRTFLPDEDQRGKERVAVLSYILWQNQFGGDASILNRTILLDNMPHQVIGILPPGGAFDRAQAQIWRPLAFEPSNMTRDFHWLTSFALLKKGVTLQQAQKEMDQIGARIAKDFPASNKDWGVGVDNYASIIIGPEMRTQVLMLLAAVGGMLLIGCANLANLALARGVSREREVTIRASLGAGRWRLIRQFLTENVLLSILGGVLGVGVGYAGMRWLLALVPPNSFPREVNVTMDSRVLLFTLAISVFTGLLFGMAPALQATKPDLAGSMKEGGRGSTVGGMRKRLRDTLVVGELALAFMSLVVSGLSIRSFFRTVNADTGIDSANVLTMSLRIPTEQFPDPARLVSYQRELRTAVAAVPGVKEVAMSCAPPLQGSCYGMPMQVAGRPMVDLANRQGGFFKIVSSGYFKVMGIKLLKGRVLTERDTQGATPALVMNNRLAQRFFPKQEPVGQHILIQEIVPGKTELRKDIPWEVVGVIADEKIGGLQDDRSAGVYVSSEQSPAYGMILVARTTLDPLRLEKAVRQAIASVNKEQAISDVRTVDQIKDQSAVGTRLAAMLLAIFSGISLLLAAIGIYGVISYSVAQRTHEMGIRAALGASAANLLGLVLRRGMILTVIGLVIGLGGTLAVTRLLVSLLYGIGPRDPVTIGMVAAMLAGVAIIACYIPARRATRIDPLVALRYE